MKLLCLSIILLVLFNSCQDSKNEGIGRFQSIEGESGNLILDTRNGKVYGWQKGVYLKVVHNVDFTNNDSINKAITEDAKRKLLKGD